jgi:hypothetical protein
VDVLLDKLAAVRASLGKYGLHLVVALLAIQALLLWLSLGPLAQISIFCTGPRSSTVAGLFGGLHLLFFALVVLGLLSLRFASLRLLYVLLLVMALATLPVQAKLVSSGELRCDSP